MLIFIHLNVFLTAFTISHLGELKLNKALDRETQSTYNITVKAIDTGNPPNHKTQTIYITVMDVNDNPPKFGNKTYTANIREESIDTQEVSNPLMFCGVTLHYV